MADRRKDSGGLPDGLIAGIILTLLGVTFLAWTATGLAALLAHGHWPQEVRFLRTPRAMRALIGDPHDLATAWPDVDPAQLPSARLFYGILVGQFLLLVMLAVWVVHTIARLRHGRRRPRRTAAKPAPPPAPRSRPATTAAVAAASGPSAQADERATETFADPFATGSAGAAGATTTAPSAVVPPPRRPHSRHPEVSLDAWFRTVPQATAPAGAGPREDTPTSVLPAGGPDAAAATRVQPLADGEVTRTYALFAPERGDKAKRVTQPAVLAAAGPAVVTTADPDTYHQTAGNRAKLGPVQVYDPLHVLDVPGRLRWAPHGGCAEPRTALARAAALLAPLRTTRPDEAIVHETAATLMRCWLHAAAVDGRPFRQVHRWSAGGVVSGEAVRVLRTHPQAANGWSGDLESALHGHPDRRDEAHALIRRLLEPLMNSVHIRDACTPPTGGGLDLASFLAERGTLYVVGERTEDPKSRPGAMPLLTALVSSVVEHGRRMAAGSSAGRLDPPLTFVLDDVATLAPVPTLPELLASGHATGLPTLAVLRSPEQALARFHRPVWQSADVRLALGDETAAALPPAVPDAVLIR